MDITDFLEDHKDFYSPEIRAEIQSRLVMRALKKQEPGFVITGKIVLGGTIYVIMFDDGPELWLQTADTISDALEFCRKYNLLVSKIDGSQTH